MRLERAIPNAETSNLKIRISRVKAPQERMQDSLLILPFEGCETISRCSFPDTDKAV